MVGGMAIGKWCSGHASARYCARSPSGLLSGWATAGKEGPMIHSGAVVAAGVSQGKSTSIPLINTNLFHMFRNDVEKRVG